MYRLLSVFSELCDDTGKMKVSALSDRVRMPRGSLQTLRIYKLGPMKLNAQNDLYQ